MNNLIDKKKNKFIDFTSFILSIAMEEDTDINMLKEKDYRQADFNNSIVTNGEDETWNGLYKMLNIPFDNEEEAYNQLEKGFQDVKFKDNESTAIVTFNNIKYVVLVA